MSKSKTYMVHISAHIMKVRKAMRIGYLVPQFPGQTHIFFWRELQALKSLGVEPVLLSTRPPPQGLIAHDWSHEAASATHYLATPNPLAAALAAHALGPKELRLACEGEPNAYKKDVALSLGAAWNLKKLAEKQGFTHVHVHSCARSALIAALCFRMGGPSYSLTLHNPLYVYGGGQSYKWRHAKFATVVSSPVLAEIQSSLKDVLPPQVALQPMGVDTDMFRRPAPWQAPDVKGPIRLFSCGRLAPVKGHLDLLAAVILLVKQGYDIRLRIAGEDDLGGSGYRKVIERFIAENGLSERVILMGAVDEKVIRDTLIESDIFALSSLDEGVPVALMEAMSCEVPTIGTKVGGVADLVRSGENGLLVPSQDPEALAQAIGHLLRAPDEAAVMAKAGRRYVVEQFGSRRSAACLLQLLDNV